MQIPNYTIFWTQNFTLGYMRNWCPQHPLHLIWMPTRRINISALQTTLGMAWVGQTKVSSSPPNLLLGLMFRPRATHKSPRYLKSPNGVHYGIATNWHGPDRKTKSQCCPIHTTSSSLWPIVVCVRLHLIHCLGDLQRWSNVTGYMDTDIKHWIQAFTSATLNITPVNLKNFFII